MQDSVFPCVASLWLEVIHSLTSLLRGVRHSHGSGSPDAKVDKPILKQAKCSVTKHVFAAPSEAWLRSIN